MRAAWTMAASSPASWHSCRKTELRACRAEGLRPKLMFESPTMVPTPGSSLLILRMPSMVSIPSRRLSSMPVVIGSTRGSNKRSSEASP